MAKKLKKKKAPVMSEKDKEIHHLNKLIEFSLRAVDGLSEELDKSFKAQANRLYEQLQIVKAKK